MQINMFKIVVFVYLPAFLGAVSNAQDVCQDDPNFRLLINASTGREEPCSWIDDIYSAGDVSFRRQEQCFKKGVKQACIRACGTCCGDNLSHTFNVRSVIGTPMEVNCSWLAKDENRQLQYCDLKKLSCPQSCGQCPTSIPTVSPSAYTTDAPTASPSSAHSIEPSSNLINIANLEEVETDEVNQGKGSTPYVVPIVATLLLVGSIGIIFFINSKQKSNERNIVALSSQQDSDLPHLSSGDFPPETGKFCEVWNCGEDGDSELASDAHLSKMESTISFAESSLSRAASTVSSAVVSMSTVFKSPKNLKVVQE